MKILIDIPKEFEVDYNTDRFAEFFHRCLVDMNTCCGNYEQETAEMMEKHLKEQTLRPGQGCGAVRRTHSIP